MAGSYYLAPALVALRDELNASNPQRDKASDGWIGDASHSARKSDHNPDYSADGVVRAFDSDKDGIDPNRLVELAKADSRVEYVIFNGFIYSRAYGFSKRIYTGVNLHQHHVHISLRHGKQFEDDKKSWGYFTGRTLADQPAPAAPTPAPPVFLPPVFPLPRDFYFGPKSGPRESVSGYFSFGADLARWQVQMAHRGWSIDVDGRYGPQTEKVVKAFQAEKGLAVDGKIGPQTWAAAWTAPVS